MYPEFSVIESQLRGLIEAQLPAHSHQVNCRSARGDERDPAGHVVAGEQDRQFTDAAADATMSADMIASAGGDQAHDNMPPYRCVNFIIALQGIFPSRS